MELVKLNQLKRQLFYRAFIRTLRAGCAATLEQRGQRFKGGLRAHAAYIRFITSGATLPSVKELFNIISYFEVSPSEFFAGLEDDGSLRFALTEKLRELSNEDLEKVSQFIDWITKL